MINREPLDEWRAFDTTVPPAAPSVLSTLHCESRLVMSLQVAKRLGLLHPGTTNCRLHRAAVNF